MMGCDPESPKLFGQNKYDVEDAARTLRKAKELEQTNSPLYQAALKYLAREQKSIGAILGKSIASKRGDK
jgi:hypothetical protein